MNLFRSEEHVRRWVLFDPSSEEGIRPVFDLAAIVFVLPRCRERLTSDYLLRAGELSRDLPSRFEQLGRAAPFWRLTPT